VPGRRAISGALRVTSQKLVATIPASYDN